MQCHRLSEMLEEADEESDDYEQRENDEACGISDIAATDSDVDEIFLMPGK